MGTNPTKAADNMYCQCRKEAARYNDKLNSREGAAELLGILFSPRMADRSALMLCGFSCAHSCGFLQRIHQMKSAGFELITEKTKSVSKYVSHDSYFLLC